MVTLTLDLILFQSFLLKILTKKVKDKQVTNSNSKAKALTVKRILHCTKFMHKKKHEG